MTHNSCTRQELESLIGTLQYAAKVIHPGRSFVRRLIDFLRTARRPYHHIRLNAHVKADLLWWKAFAASWNGTAFFPPPPGLVIEFASDASGTWGCGAWSDSRWWKFQWPAGIYRAIAFKELFAVIVSLVVWATHLRGSRVHGYCDNQAVTDVIKSRTNKEPQLMHLLRCLFFIEAEYHIILSVSHIAGVNNDLADDLSCNRLSSFLQKLPWANPLPTPIPPALPDLLLDPSTIWTSPSWMQRFVASATLA